MVQLSKRLLAVASLVTRGNVVADIGCDHAYTSIYLCEQGISPSVIAMDVRTGPLERAKENIKRYDLQSKISLRLSDGLETLSPGEADTVLLAGMGGILMMKILTDYPTTTASVKELILQPQSEIAEVRRFLHKSGYQIAMEQMVKEDGKFYVMMRATKTELPEQYQTECEYAYGKLLIDSEDEVLKEFLLREERLLTGVLTELTNQDTQKAIERKQEIQHQLSIIRSIQK